MTGCVFFELTGTIEEMLMRIAVVQLGSTASYVSDVANRLQGWNGNGAGFSQCQ
jgi:hypothetical protein